MIASMPTSENSVISSSNVKQETLNSKPSTFSLVKGIIGATLKQKGGSEKKVPNLQLALYGQVADPKAVKHYNKVCGFDNSNHLAPTWPHMMAFPLHIKLLTNPAFPFPLAGLVHVKNTISQARPISIDEPLDFTCTLSQGEANPKGITFDITTEVKSGGKLVWLEVSTNLYRTKTSNKAPSKDKAKLKKTNRLPAYDHFSEWLIPAGKGRDYAKVSGDFNPIHLSDASAKVLGFKAAIIHGMWSKARILAELNHQLPDAFTVDVEFKLPVFMPSNVKLSWENSGENIEFLLSDKLITKPYLKGYVTPLK